MVWFDFKDLVTTHFDMSASVPARFFELVPSPELGGAPTGDPTWNELTFGDYSFVPRAPKNFYDQLPADKRERDFCLVWMPGDAATRLKTVKVNGENAGRILDVQRNKWYVVADEWDYGRQGNLGGVIGELVDGPPPGNLPPIV